MRDYIVSGWSIDPDSGRYVIRRIVEEAEYHAVKAEAGKKGGVAKADSASRLLASKTLAGSESLVEANVYPPPPPTPPPTPATQEAFVAGQELFAEPGSAATSSPSPRVARISPAYSRDFLAFWAAYPKKVEKRAAWLEWQNHKPPLDACLKAIEWQRQSEKWTSGFILHPLRWIKRHCWEDEPCETRTAPKTDDTDAMFNRLLQKELARGRADGTPDHVPQLGQATVGLLRPGHPQGPDCRSLAGYARPERD